MRAAIRNTMLWQKPQDSLTPALPNEQTPWHSIKMRVIGDFYEQWRDQQSLSMWNLAFCCAERTTPSQSSKEPGILRRKTPHQICNPGPEPANESQVNQLKQLPRSAKNYSTEQSWITTLKGRQRAHSGDQPWYSDAFDKVQNCWSSSINSWSIQESHFVV